MDSPEGALAHRTLNKLNDLISKVKARKTWLGLVALVSLGPAALGVVAASATYSNLTTQEANLGRSDHPIEAPQEKSVSRCPLTLPDQVGVTLIVTKLSVADRLLDVVPIIDVP